MGYVILGRDVPDSHDKRLAARAEHLGRLTALQTAGRFVLAGPCPAIDSPDPGAAGFTGSVIIADFDSLAAACAWADADPYLAAGVYLSVEVLPFKQVF